MPPATNNISPYLTMGVETANGIINNFAADMRARAQRKWSEKMMEKQNQWNLEMWNKTNEYNDPANQVARLDAAGLNPLYYGLDGSSANALESATPLNYTRASDTIGLANPASAYQDAVIKNEQAGLLESQKNNVEADTALKESQTDANNLSNRFNRITLEARAEAEYLKNEMTRKEIKLAEKRIEQVDQEIKESAARTENELVKKGLIEVQTRLTKVQADEIVALLPYRKELMAAQTQAERAKATADMTHALYEQGLIDGGYIDALVADMKARARQSDSQADLNEVQKELDEWALSVKNGTYFSEEKGNASHTWVGRAFDHIGNSLMEFLSTLGTALGPLTSVAGAAVGGKVLGSSAGKGLEKGIEKSQSPQFRPKYPSN